MREPAEVYPHLIVMTACSRPTTVGTREEAGNGYRKAPVLSVFNVLICLMCT